MLFIVLLIVLQFIQHSHASLAFYIQVYEGNIKESVRLMQRIYVPSPFVYAIHVDAKLDASSSSRSRMAYQELLEQFESLPNVYFLKRHPVTYRGVSMLLSTLDGIETLLKAL